MSGQPAMPFGELQVIVGLVLYGLIVGLVLYGLIVGLVLYGLIVVHVVCGLIGGLILRDFVLCTLCVGGLCPLEQEDSRVGRRRKRGEQILHSII